LGERLGKAGFKIVISDMNMDLVNKRVDKFKNNNIDAIAIEGDVSKHDDQFNVVAEAVNKFGSVDAFINNAGIDQQVCGIVLMPVWSNIKD